MANDNQQVKDSIKPLNPVNIIQTYEKEINSVYGRLDQFRGEYIQMKKTSEERTAQLEIEKNELVFKINELNNEIWARKQEIEVYIRENRSLKQTNAHLKEMTQQSSGKIA